jgi:mannose-1-phosphate guanylyltransferase/mannose-6-phosphate isomerase
VLFGLQPTFPATAYGYIEPGPPLEGGVREVARFVEKPPQAEAERLCAAGCLWNSGLFLMRADRLIAELEAHAPQVLAAARAAVDRAQADPDFLRLDPEAFAASPSISIDHAVMERTARAAVVPADFAWSDIGSWSAVWEAQIRDANDNATRGVSVLQDVSGCLIFTEGPQIAACGVSGLVIVATAEQVLIVPREQDQMVRALAERSDEGA